MKKLIVMVLSLAACTAGVAQEGMKHGKGVLHEMHNSNGKTPEERAQHQVNSLDTLLALSPEQKTKVHDAALKKQNAVKAAKDTHKADTDTDKKAMGQEIKTANQTYKTELDAILTPEQQAKLKKHQEEIQAKHHDAKKPAMVEPTDTEVSE